MSAQQEPSEEQLRAAYEEELSRIEAADMIAQATVSLLNIGAHRLAPAPAAGAGGEGVPAGPDAPALEQARDAIDAARALLEILSRRVSQQDLRPLRDALSRLQMTYATMLAPDAGAGQPEPGAGESGPAPSAAPGGAEEPAGAADAGPGGAPGSGGESGPGPAESSGRLWVPGR